MAMPIPPVKTLMTFTVVAQTLSFSKAAVLLNLTQSAISKQILQLEAQIGCTLFERSGGKIELTEMGRRYLPSVVEALENLQHATSNIMQTPHTKSRIALSLPPSVASMWLIPRLEHFRQSLPNIELAVKASITSDIQNRFQGDIAVHCLPLANLDEEAELLVRERLMLVVSPALITSPIRNIRDLLLYHSISHITRPQIWQQFWHSHGIAPDSPSYGVGFEHFYMALEAVKQQQGMALIPEFLVNDSLLKGEVINPLGLYFDSQYGYFLYSLGYKRRLEPVSQVISWLRDKMPR
ncbi:LysR substrate-binding domain-containing protein [Enterovibrio paralichthyis]|uniref:LysR substrate-binding domain-containing protein n=1 Tax=Enterovibrio paralichthyis TaxID=2853805 RepID=UPI001C462676|nr:LysR substrate-binding domain-containing protein [Enterovibrio paralichthyis]MBV7300041.1 LysR family transcriptional regulator [Enterovibrio paralichthyis]